MGPVDLTPFVPRLLADRSPTAPRHWQVDATMTFIDISGFTSLSEQLARRGRVGAEDLVSTLTRLFTLLMSASDDGGDVVKFAGDALLVMYDGPDHQLHACHAAHACQRVLDVVGGVRLAGARARLRMSVGVHTGRFDMMLTGGANQNLVVAGPDLDTVLALEGDAAAGQVLISERTAAALPASARGARVGQGFLLRRMAPVESVGLGSAPAPRAGDLTRFLPAPFERRPDLLRADSDHRRAATAFVQASGLNAALPDAPLPVVDAITTVVERACEELGVTLLDTDIAPDGYRYFLTAGAPHTVEDPEGRLLRTLLRIVAADSPLTLRAGTSSGRVFAGPVGASFRRTYSVMGDTTNLAARLTARAPLGAVLAPDAVVERSSTAFLAEEHEPVRVKGKADEIPVRVVTDVLTPRRRSQGDTAFTGRERELALLTGELAGVREGRRAVVEVVGEPGLGKTRLVQESIAASGLRAIPVETDPYATHVPHHTLAELLRPLLGLTTSDGAAASGARLHATVAERAPDQLRWLPLLAPALRAEVAPTTAVDDLDERFRTARFHDAVRTLLAATLPADAVVVVDDAQWVDQTSSDAIASAFSSPEGPSCGLLLTRRDEERGLRGGEGLTATELRLEPLPEEAARQLVAAEAELRGAQVGAVVERAGGNPYFLLELAASRGTELPDSIEDLVGLRVDQLDGDDRDLLRQAAVLGARFPAELFTETTGFGEVADVVGAAGTSGLGQFLLVEDGGTIAFRREIHRQVAYEQLTFRRRREAHRKAARAIARSPALGGSARLPLLSLHSHAAGEWADAFRYSCEAAAETRAQFANDEAAVFSERALDAGRRSGQPPAALAGIAVGLGDVLTLTGDHEAAVTAYRRARKGLSSAEQVAEVVHKIGMVQRESGHYSSALAAARRVLRLADEVPDPRGRELRVEAELLRAGVRYWQGDCDACRRLTLQAVTEAESLPDGVERTRLLARSYSLHDTAQIELEGRAGSYGTKPLDMLAEVGDLYNEGRFAVNLAVGEYYEGRWESAVSLYHRSLELAERIGDVFSVAVAKMNIGEVLSLQGRGDEAVPLLMASVHELRALHTPLAAAHAALYLSVAHRLSGRVADARARTDEAAALFREAGRDSGFSLDDLATRELELMVDEGRAAEVVTTADGLLDRPTPMAPLHRARTLRARALARHQEGDAEAAAADLAQSLEVGRGIALGHEAALSLLVRADWTASTEDRDEALRLLERLGATALAGR